MVWKAGLVLLASVLLVWGCLPQVSGGGGERPEITSSPQWQMVGDAPVLQAGSLRDQALWNDPSVLKLDGQYVMYLTTSTEKPFEPPILPFRTVSSDGTTWQLSPDTPLLSAEGGPYVSVETPSVVRFGGQWHMFFTGIYPGGADTPMGIGRATSADGLVWKVQAWELFLHDPGEPWRSYLVGEPGAVVHNGRLHVYMSAVGGRPGGGPPAQSLALAVSSDGVTFSRPERVLTQSDLYPAEQGFAGYSSPAALSHNGRVHLFFSVAHWLPGGNPEWTQIAIHHASSADGVTAFLQDQTALLSYTDRVWTEGEVLAPSPLVEDDEIKLWFGGHVPNSALRPLIVRGISGPEFGIGLARAPLSALSAQ